MAFFKQYTSQIQILRLPHTENYKKREFKKLRRQLQRKHHIKIELCFKLSVLRLFIVGHVVQTRRSAFSFAWHEWFHVKAKNERFTVASSRCRQNLKYENFTSLSGRLHQKACRTCTTIIFLHSTNQIIDLWRCCCRCRR